MEDLDFGNKQLEIWDNIQGLNFLVWAPMLVLGGFSLSGKLETQAAWWLENVVSNLYIPFLLDETYELLEFAIFEGEWKNYAKLLLWSTNTFVVVSAHMGCGTSAISYLRGIDQTSE